MKNIHSQNDIIAERYSIVNLLGSGGFGSTYAATDFKTQKTIAIKCLSLKNLDNWKNADLLAKEAQILQQLNHPNIPKYLDYFQIETESDTFFYLVQELAPGQSLASLTESGWQPNEKIVKGIAAQILEILVYLQQQIPPIIHRDIKPENLIYSQENQQVFLVDFGGVQDKYHQTMTCQTVVGTYGYMAPEQYQGGANLTTDLYGLGNTLIFLLTGKHPTDLPQKKLKIQFKKYVNISSEFYKWLEKLIEPLPENRFENARDSQEVFLKRKPLMKESNLLINNQNNQLNIRFLPGIVHNRYPRLFYLFVMSELFGLIYISFALKACTNNNYGIIFILFWLILLSINYIKPILNILKPKINIQIISNSLYIILITTILIIIPVQYNWNNSWQFVYGITIVAVIIGLSKWPRFLIFKELFLERNLIIEHQNIIVTEYFFKGKINRYSLNLWQFNYNFENGLKLTNNQQTKKSYTFGYLLGNNEKKWLKTQGKLELAKILLLAGAKVTIKTLYDTTILYFLASEGELKLDKITEINFHNSKDYVILGLVQDSEKLEIVNMLRERGTNINFDTTQNISYLHSAANQGHTEIVKILIEAGADVNSHNIDGGTPLHSAANQGHTEIVRMLIEAGADVNSRNANCYTSLHYAANQGHTEIVKILIEVGADVNFRNIRCYTSLDYAANQGHIEIVKMLIEAGADVNSRDIYGYTSLDWAANQGHTEIVELLEQHTK